MHTWGRAGFQLHTVRGQPPLMRRPLHPAAPCPARTFLLHSIQAAVYQGRQARGIIVPLKGGQVQGLVLQQISGKESAHDGGKMEAEAVAAVGADRLLQLPRSEAPQLHVHCSCASNILQPIRWASELTFGPITAAATTVILLGRWWA